MNHLFYANLFPSQKQNQSTFSYIALLCSHVHVDVPSYVAPAALDSSILELNGISG